MPSSDGMALSGSAVHPALHVVLATTGLLLLLLLLVAWRRRRPGANLPPGPPGLPLVGSLHLIGALPHRSLAKLAKQYGPLMAIRLGPAQYIVASSPRTAKEFLKTQDANFFSRNPMRAGQVMFGQDILFQSNMAECRQLRRLFHLGLTGSKRVEATRHVRGEEVAQLLRSLPQNCEFNLRNYLSLLVTGIIPRLIVNRSFSARSLSGIHELPLLTERLREIQSFQATMSAIFKGLSAFYPADFIPAVRWVLPDYHGLDSRFRDTNKRMDAFAAQIITDHQARRARGPVTEHEKDMVHVLLDEVENYNANAGRTGPPITMANVNSIMWDAFSGGTDTILFSSKWIMSEVVSNPSVQAAAQAELDREVGRQRRVQEADLPHLHYTQAVVKEGMRLHPIAPVMAPHQSLHATKACRYDIPANTRLIVNVWAISHDPAVWSNFMQFQPERWLGLDEADLGRVAAECEFLPFGAGRRICPGMSLATVTLEHCVASLLQAFEWSVTADPGMKEAPGIDVPRARSRCASWLARDCRCR